MRARDGQEATRGRCDVMKTGAEKRACRGQTALEYALILGAVILVIVAAASGPIRTALTQMFSDAGNKITDASSRFAR